MIYFHAMTHSREWNEIGFGGFEARKGGVSCLFSQEVCLYIILVYEILRLKLNFSQSVLLLNTLIHDLIFLKKAFNDANIHNMVCSQIPFQYFFYLFLFFLLATFHFQPTFKIN